VGSAGAGVVQSAVVAEGDRAAGVDHIAANPGDLGQSAQDDTLEAFRARRPLRNAAA
jgi:hypothetical protein